MVGNIHYINKENIVWYNNKIKKSQSCIDIEVVGCKEIAALDMVLLPDRREPVIVMIANFNRFANMPRASMGGQMIRVANISVSNPIIPTW